MENFRMTLRELRKEHGMTQSELAEKIGCAPNTICMYEQGRREPSFETMRAIAAVFGLPADALLRKAPDEDDDEIWALREQLRRRPEMRMLFSATRKASRDDILKAVKIIEALSDSTDD